MRKFSSACDAVTLENEFVDYRRLEFLEHHGVNVIPHSQTIALIQDKLLQKESLKRHRILVPDFLAIKSERDCEQAAAALNYPLVLKSRKMGYDGYGNATVTDKSDFVSAYRRLAKRYSKVMAEQFVDFRMELAVMVARTRREIRVYPVVQTIQENHICHTVIAPAQIDPRTARNAKEIAVESVKAIKGFGLFGVELFLTRSEELIVNELAPRPHNSGHYTIDACVTSQFENHARSVLNFPLGSPAMTKRYAVMVNLLGNPKPSRGRKNFTTSLAHPDVHLHIYGKRLSRAGRKMGHITLVGDALKPLLRQASSIASKVAL
jgi:5-(carboxyamino)imidazole ribonucleotide synthase